VWRASERRWTPIALAPAASCAAQGVADLRRTMACRPLAAPRGLHLIHFPVCLPAGSRWGKVVEVEVQRQSAVQFTSVHERVDELSVRIHKQLSSAGRRMPRRARTSVPRPTPGAANTPEPSGRSVGNPGAGERGGLESTTSNAICRSAACRKDCLGDDACSLLSSWRAAAYPAVSHHSSANDHVCRGGRW
jgi:hypothetical protein